MTKNEVLLFFNALKSTRIMQNGDPLLAPCFSTSPLAPLHLLPSPALDHQKNPINCWFCFVSLIILFGALFPTSIYLTKTSWFMFLSKTQCWGRAKLNCQEVYWNTNTFSKSWKFGNRNYFQKMKIENIISNQMDPKKIILHVSELKQSQILFF